MAYYQNQYPQQQSAQNLQFYQSSYPTGTTPVSGHTTPNQASYGGYGGANTSSAYPSYGGSAGFAGPAAGVSGRMGEQGGLRTGWLAAFGTEGYEGEPPLLEELGVNFEHIRTKVGCAVYSSLRCADMVNRLLRSSIHWQSHHQILWTIVTYMAHFCSSSSMEHSWHYPASSSTVTSMALRSSDHLRSTLSSPS